MNQYIQEQAMLYLSKLKQQQGANSVEHQRSEDQRAYHHRRISLSGLVAGLLRPAPTRRRERRTRQMV